MQRTSLLLWAGSSLAVLGIVLLCSWDSVYSFISRKELRLSPSSTLHWFWKETQIPVFMDVYLFNCTNPDQLMEKDFKPELVQLGPYSFIERDEKVNISWNTNHTVTYQMVRRFYYDSQNSNGSLQDNLTSLDIAALAVSHMTRYWSYFSVIPVSAAIRFFGKSVWMTRSVGDWLVNGYTDPLLTLSKMTPGFSQSKTSKDKMGMIYERNCSTMFDGVMNVNTGEEDFSEMGTIHYYDYYNHTVNFGGQCGRVTGSLGDFFGPIPSKERRMDVFLAEACRSIPLEYLQDVVVNGVTGYRYGINNKVLDNGTTDLDTRCNCGGDCLPQGVINATKCLRDAPVYLSYPHFLHADPHYRRQVSGMQPDPHIHSFYITVEPITGITLEANFVLQFNMLLQSNRNIGLYRHVPTVMIPVMWFEKRFTVPPRYTTLISLFHKLPIIGLYSSVGILSLGLILLAFTFLHKILVHTEPLRSERRLSNGQTMQESATSPEENGLLGPKAA